MYLVQVMRNVKAVKEIRAFNRFYTNAIGVVDRHILESRYSLTEVRILFEIYHDPEATARKIKNFLRVDEGYLSRTVEKLIRLGLIVKKQSKVDGRQFMLSLTKKGEKIFLSLNARSEAAVESTIAHLSSGEIVELITMVRKIRELLTKESS